MDNKGKVSAEIKDGIKTINFYHPKSNSLPGYMLKQITNEIQSAANDNKVKVIVLKSEGEKVFCAGASFEELLAIDNFEKGKEFFMGFMRLINAIRKCPKFVIGRIQGKSVGGGVGIAAAVDYAMGTKYSSIKLSELALGIGPFVVGPAVIRKIGKGSFSAMAIDFNWRSAEWAEQKGMFNHIYDTIEELDKAVNILAARLAAGSPEAMAMLKKIFWEGTDNWDTMLKERAEISGKLVLSDFTKKYIKSFIQKSKQ